MRIFPGGTVLDAARERIDYLFGEFPNVVVGVSGGKDSTVVLNLALAEAERRGRLPLRVLFLDQEAEWQCVIDHIRTVMEDPRVEPMWMQFPFRLFNATSTEQPWLDCWDPAQEAVWIHPRWPRAYTENRYGADRFGELFGAVLREHFPDQPTCYLAGVRTEESPGRFMGLTSNPTYKHITAGKILDRRRNHYSFYPIYDWTFRDVWKAIHEHGWPYCRLYDLMHQYGVEVQAMRVSNIHHETATRSLFYLQELEPDTWERVTRRLKGVHSASVLQYEALEVKELPPMFSSWPEYRDFLAEKLIPDEAARARFLKKFHSMDRQYQGIKHPEGMYRVQVATVLTNDQSFTKLQSWIGSGVVHGWRQFHRGNFHPSHATNRLIHG